MSGYFQTLALDLDGTLALGDVVPRRVLDALAEARAGGLTTVLATGRIEAELDAGFPDLARRFDALVLENGAVVGLPGDVAPAAPPVDAALSQELLHRGVPHRRGAAILALSGTATAAVTDAIHALGLDCQLVHNRAELMVLPAGVTKGTGLRAALDRLGRPLHNTVAVGDAENDLALLQAAEIGVAVANATASLRAHADLVLTNAAGDGVLELLHGPVLAGTTGLQPARRQVRIGLTADGEAVTVPGARATIVVGGLSGSGKSRLAGLLVERWHAAGYTALVIDPEGDHHSLATLPGVVLADAHALPTVSDLVQLLRQERLSVVLDTSGLTGEAAGAYLRRLAVAVSQARAVCGLPHWVLLDEAHGPLGENGVVTDIFRPTERGHCLVTYQPDRLWTPALTTADVILTALPGPVAPPDDTGAPRATIRHAGGTDLLFHVDDRVTEHSRHGRKYSQMLLPEHQSFVFRDGRGHPRTTARTVHDFLQQLGAADAASVQHHAVRGDFSRWLLGTVQDPALATAAGIVESELVARIEVDVDRARTRLLDVIGARTRGRTDPPRT